jgi:hypothetical protein
MTETGVRLDWWTALHRIVELLKDDEKRLAMRPNCIRRAEAYSADAFSQRLDALLESMEAAKDAPGEPLRITPFASEYWVTCGILHQSAPPYRRGPRSLELYRALIEPYAGTSEITHPAQRSIAPEDILTLSAPAIPLSDERLFLNDPIFPEEITIPEEFRPWAKPLIEAMAREPAVRWERLRDILEIREAGLEAVPLWLAHVGVLGISAPEEGGIDPAIIGDQMSRLLFAIRRVKAPCDIVALM